MTRYMATPRPVALRRYRRKLAIRITAQSAVWLVALLVCPLPLKLLVLALMVLSMAGA